MDEEWEINRSMTRNSKWNREDGEDTHTHTEEKWSKIQKRGVRRERVVCGVQEKVIM